jgi:hypothetical protein
LPDWAITTTIDARESWSTVARAITCHQSQVAAYGCLADVPPAQQRVL